MSISLTPIKFKALSLQRNRRRGRVPVLKELQSFWKLGIFISYLSHLYPNNTASENWSPLGYGPGHLFTLYAPWVNSLTSMALNTCYVPETSKFIPRV